MSASSRGNGSGRLAARPREYHWRRRPSTTRRCSPRQGRVYYADPGAKEIVAWASVRNGAPWDTAPEMRMSGGHVAHIGLASGGFIMLNNVDGAPEDLRLRWYRQGSPREGETAFLHFQSGQTSGVPSVNGDEGAFNGGSGMVFWKNLSSGFWYIPYSDIDDYLKKVKQASAPAPVVGAAEAPAGGEPFVASGWHSYSGLDAAGEPLTASCATCSEGKLWILGRYGSDPVFRLLGIDLQTFADESTEVTPAGRLAFGMAITPDAFYVQHAGAADADGRIRSGAISRYDRKKKTWETRQIPWENPRIYVVNGVLYLAFHGWAGGVETSAIARYDWDSGKITTLASNRRNPARNQFDNCNPYFLGRVFEGPGTGPA